MNGNAPLQTALLDLLQELRDTDIRLIVGGGFGIYLRTDHMINQPGLRTFFPPERWPEARSTNDLDLFLRAELFVNTANLQQLGDALKRLDYHPIEDAKYYQFAKKGVPGISTGVLKIDLLAGPRETFRNLGIKADHRRVRPKPSVNLHAHPVDEVPTLEDKLTELPMEGLLSSGDPFKAEIYLPHPFSFLTMKLYAFRDLHGDEGKDYARHHALDIYSVVGTVTESEWAECIGFRDQLKNHAVLAEVGRIVRDFFSDEDHEGIIRLKESPYSRPDFEVIQFISILKELFPELS